MINTRACYSIWNKTLSFSSIAKPAKLSIKKTLIAVPKLLLISTDYLCLDLSLSRSGELKVPDKIYDGF